MRTRTLVGATALTSALAPQVVRAKAGAVQLELRGCPFVDANEVRRVVRTELGSALEPGAKPRVAARCEGDRVDLEVADARSSAPLTRSFTLGERGAGVSRLIGIAAAELILESQEVETTANRVPARGKADARSAARTANRGERRGFDDAEELEDLPGRRARDTRLRLLGLGSRRALFAYGGALWGGSLRLEAEPLEHLSWATDISYERGAFTAHSARYAVETWTLGAHLFFSHEVAPFLLRAGGGLRAGFAASTPRADEEQDTGVLASWGWPLLTLNVSMRLGPRLVMELSSEASYVVLPVSARGSTLRGMWLGNQVGLGYVF